MFLALFPSIFHFTHVSRIYCEISSRPTSRFIFKGRNANAHVTSYSGFFVAREKRKHDSQGEHRYRIVIPLDIRYSSTSDDDNDDDDDGGDDDDDDDGAGARFTLTSASSRARCINGSNDKCHRRRLRNRVYARIIDTAAHLSPSPLFPCSFSVLLCRFLRAPFFHYLA